MSKREYIWCYVTDENTIVPLGSVKTLDYALEVGSYGYPSSDKVKLFKIIEVKNDN